MRTRFDALLVGALLCAPALAGDKYVIQITPSRVIRLDGTTGAIVNPNFLDIDALAGFGGVFQETRDAVVTPNGEIWISNTSNQRVYRFSGDGTMLLGSFVTGSCAGLEVANNRLWVVETSGGFGAGLVQYDLATQMPLASTPITSPRDVYAYNGALLVSDFAGSISSVDPSTGMLTGVFSTPGSLLYQMTELATGNLLVARWGPPGLYVIDPAGTLLSTLPVGFGQPEGVAELGNGHYLVSTQQGIFSYDPVLQTGVSIDSHPALFVFEIPIVLTGTGFCFGDGSGTACPCANAGALGNGCASSVNASGAHLQAVGTASLANDTLVMTGTNMPNSSALYFQGTTQVGAGLGAVFGDGLRCAGGSVIRLKTKTNVAGESSYPAELAPQVALKAQLTFTRQSTKHGI
jgi:hypothetical protein